MEQRETHQSHCGILLGETLWKILFHSGQSSLIRPVCNLARDFPYFLPSTAPNSLQVVIAAMKLKDAYSLEGRL